MATTQEIKDLKRADLDALAVEQGLDPAQYSKADDLRAELLKTADDADDNGDDEDTTTPGGADEQNTTTESANQAVNEAETAANAAEVPEVRKPAGSSGHAAKFDKYGQPVFGSK